MVTAYPGGVALAWTRGLNSRTMSTARARAFRKSLTPQEARLWVQLKALRSDGLHFRRQAPFRGYYLDFVCFERRLVIEVDGSQHADPDGTDHDRVRDAVLKREGFTVLRFWNHEINTSLAEVLDVILAKVTSSRRRGGVVRRGTGSGLVDQHATPPPRPLARPRPPHKREGE